MAELNDNIENNSNGRLGYNSIKSGVNGVKIDPIRPATLHIEKNLCRRFVGKTSIVNIYRQLKAIVISNFPDTNIIVLYRVPGMTSARMLNTPLPIIPMNSVFFRPNFSMRKLVRK